MIRGEEDLVSNLLIGRRKTFFRGHKRYAMKKRSTLFASCCSAPCFPTFRQLRVYGDGR